MNSGTGSHIEDMIGGENGIGVMFDDNDAVAQISQFQQGIDQFLVVSLVQADTWFIKDIENSGQPRADLRGKANSLRLSTGECPRPSAPRER